LCTRRIGDGNAGRFGGFSDGDKSRKDALSMAVGVPALIPTTRMVTGAHASITVAEITLGAFPRGAVLVLGDAGGLERTAQVMNLLAEHGYETLAVDLCGRTHESYWVTLMLERLAERGWQWEQIGVLGYHGAALLALRTATRHRLGAAVSLDIPQCALCLPAIDQSATQLQTPWLGLSGAAEADSPAALLAAHWDRRHRAGLVHSRFVSYRGVPEHFLLDSGDTAAHAAAFDSWQRTVEWLDARVVPRLTPRSLAWRSRLRSATGSP
jgi:carboxymethylenebutenolidase